MFRLSHFISTVLERLICAFLAVIVILVFSQVFFRYVIHKAFPGTEELVNISFIWVVFLGAALSIKRKRHLSIDIFTKRLPQKAQALWEITIYILTMIYAFFILFEGIKYVAISWQKITDYFRIPMSLAYAILPLTALLMIFYLIELIRQRAFGDKKD
jgi:TRAP-type C4-dicarboxylate transport system permease small subunit